MGEMVWVRVRSRPIRGYWSAQMHFGPDEIFRQVERHQAEEICGEELLIAEVVADADVPAGWTSDGHFIDASGDEVTPAEPPAPPAPAVDYERKPELAKGDEDDADKSGFEDLTAPVAPKGKHNRR